MYPAGRGVRAPRTARELLKDELIALTRLAGPVAASRLGIMTMGLTDSLVVGRYSATQLGYHALGWAPTGVALMSAIGLVSGVQVMAARALGEGRRREAGAVLRRGLVYAALVGLAATALMIVLGPLLLHHLGLDPHLADGATPVLLIFSLSLTPYMVSVAATLWLEALSRSSTVLALMWLANAVNLAIDLVLVPGGFGVPAQGAMGGAWATLGARSALAAAALIYIARMAEARELGVFDKPKRALAAEVEQRKIGYGAGASNFLEAAAFSAMTVVAGRVGGPAVAAWSVVLNVVSIVFMVPLGLSTATAVRVGRGYGARDLAAVNRAAGVGFAVTVICGVVSALLLWPGAGLIARVYTHDPVVIRLAADALALSCLFLIPDGLQVVAAQALRARGEVWLPTATHLASYSLVMTPLAWVLGLNLGWGMSGIVWAVTVASFVSAGLLLARFWILKGRGL